MEHTINAMTKMLINNRHHDNKTISRVIDSNGIKPVGKSNRGWDLYNFEEVEAALLSTVIQSESNTPAHDGDDFIDLKKEKLRREIEAINKDNQKKDLQIEQLKSQLVDYQEGLQYLITRKALEAAIMRRIFLTNMPIEVTGLNKAKAREKGETYYNEITRICNDTIQLWQDKFNNSEDELVKKIEKKLKEILGLAETNEIKQTTDTCDPSI